MGASHLSGPLYVGGQYVPGWNTPRPGRTFYLAAGGSDGSGIAAGSDSQDGLSWESPFLTLERFLDDVKTFDRLFFVGDIREENLVGSNLAFDVQIVGAGGRHHPDVPSASYHPGGAMIRPPASPTLTTPLLALRGRGWEFHNVHFDCPVDAAAVELRANALSGESEWDASHAGFYNCTFQQGLRGIQDIGGVINVEVIGCTFRIMSPAGACAIESTSTAVRLPQFWKILNSYFPGVAASGGNECHIDTPLSGSIIKGCVFGLVEGTDLYIDLTGGDDNQVTENLLAGTYDTSDYAPGTADDWTGNFSADVGQAEVGDNGITVAVPAAP
jgi:hypothetical protein